MANRPTQPDETWRADPRRDFLAYQLLALARVLLNAYFDDPGNIGYVIWLNEKPRRKGKDERLVLDEREDDPEHGILRLSGLRTESSFVLELTHADFAGEAAITFDIDEARMSAGRIEHFRGDMAAAAAAADHWIDVVLEEDELGDDDLAEIFGGAGSSDEDDDEDEDHLALDAPPPDRPEDRRAVQRMARYLRGRFGKSEPPQLDLKDGDWLENTPQSLWPILDGAVAAGSAAKRDDTLLAAWFMLLTTQLELIRYRAERGRGWADAMLNEYQDRLIRLAGDNTVPHEILFQLAASLGHAKVAVKPELSEAVASAGPAVPAAMPPQQALEQMVRPLITELADHVGSPFEVMEAISEATAVMPAEVRVFMAHELALSPHAVMREAVPLLLLDASSAVRRAAALALEQSAAPDTLSPVSLRRAIALRNWIPEADRATLDQAIRKARSKGVQPAQWEAAVQHIVRASSVDGSGAQSVVFTGKSGRVGLFAGLLLKSGFGIRDAWCDLAAPRRDIAAAIADLQRNVSAPEVESSYIDIVVQHAIAAGVASGHTPDAPLLQIAEVVNASDWKARAINVPDEVEQMFGELPPEQRSTAAVGASLARSRAWMQGNSLTDSWFEDDAEVNAMLGSLRRESLTQAARALLDGLLSERRGVWAERFLLVAQWARAIKPGQPSPLGSGAKAITWRNLVVLAHEVQSSRPLHEIPVMVELAEQTVRAGRSDRW